MERSKSEVSMGPDDAVTSTKEVAPVTAKSSSDTLAIAVGCNSNITMASSNATLYPNQSTEEFGTGSSTDVDRPKSSCSGEALFEAKRRRRKIVSGPNVHTVTFTVNIAMAVPTVEDDCQPNIKDMLKKKKSIFEAPRAQNYYHMEYVLVPDDDESTKTDVVMYGMASKLYMERHDPRVLKTWQHGDLSWIAWTNTHAITVTNDVLINIFNHNLELRVWDTKDKVSTRARFDRPKAFRLPHAKPGEDPEDIGGVRASVLRQNKLFNDLQPKKGGKVRPLPNTVSSFLDNPAKKRGQEKNTRRTSVSVNTEPKVASPNTLVAVANKDTAGQDGRTYSRLGRLAGAESPTREASRSRPGTDKSKKGGSASKPRTTSPTPQDGRTGSRAGAGIGDENVTKRRGKKNDAAAQAAELVKKFGICVVPIKMSLLFSGIKSITSRLDQSINGIEDMYITVSVDGPLMTDRQKLDLNPMVIKIQSATNLPETPMSFSELQNKCQPVYCKYSFYKQPSHITDGKEHSRNVYWDDISVVLLGTMDASALREYLSGPPLEIEVHDRDRKVEEVKLKPTLFGDDLEDEKISSVGTVTSRRTLHNPFKVRNKPWDPSGVGKLDLSELLLGHRYLHLKVPIQNSLIPDVLGEDNVGGSKRIIGVDGAVDGPVDRPLSSGHYMNNTATLKVKVALAHPLNTPTMVTAKLPLLSTKECPFGRIVFIFDYKNIQMLQKIQFLLTKINSLALELNDMPQHVINAALSTYKLSIEQQTSWHLDIVTGFHVLDGKMHIFVLEGLRDRAVPLLWNELPQPQNSDIRVLYNSDLAFSSRLYGPLDVDLCRVKLHESLSEITQQSLLYVRDMVPKPCFHALVKLIDLNKTQTFRGLARNELFPTAEMIISLSKEFGVPFTAEDIEELRLLSEKDSPDTDTKLTEEIKVRRRIWSPMDNFNPDYLEKIAQRGEMECVHDFIKDNMDDVQEKSIKNQLENSKSQPMTVKTDVKVAHNYSTQTLNSSEQAKEKLRLMLTKDPSTRHTYCQDYHHSMTVIPVNIKQLQKEAEDESRSRWRTEAGFVYPSVKTTQESNAHPKQPHVARMHELKQQWRENLLHVNTMQSPLSRNNFPWYYRKQDFQRYRQPQSGFGNEPITIHLAGEKLLQEKLSSRRKEHTIWKSKIVVDDIRHHTHRCLPETEMNNSSSNQMDRLCGMLKDSPSKLALKRQGLSLREIPPLKVVSNPSVDGAARAAGIPMYPAVADEGAGKTKGFKPGPHESRRWQLENNKIPVFDNNREKFATLKGKDFNVYHTERKNLWNRQIHPLSDSDRDNHLFRMLDDPAIWGPVDNTGFDLDRSYTQPIISHAGGMTLTSKSRAVDKKMEIVS